MKHISKSVSPMAFNLGHVVTLEGILGVSTFCDHDLEVYKKVNGDVNYKNQSSLCNISIVFHQ